MLASLDPQRWIVVNDGVMGGRSQGAVRRAAAGEEPGDPDPPLVFDGVLRTRGGGFTSIRSLGLTGSLEGAREIVLQIRGDGRRYRCDLRDTPRIRGFGVTWRREFDTAPDWREVRLALESFRPTWRGRDLNPRAVSASARDPDAPFWTHTRSIGFTIADGIDGPFELQVARIDAR